jgi:hypothetical protein
MLKGSGLKAIASLIPLLSTSGGEEEAQDMFRDQVASLGASVDSLLKALPQGLEEVDSRLLESVRLLQAEINNLKSGYEQVQMDMFGILDPTTLIILLPRPWRTCGASLALLMHV